MCAKYSLVLSSGTVDKLMAAATLAAGAMAMGKEVNLFLMYGGLLAFRKDAWKTNARFSADLGECAAQTRERLQAKRAPSWISTLEQVAEIGTLHVTACGATMDLFDLTLADLEPIVREVSGVATFIDDSDGGTTLFI
jgi:peroxiredoxin family protein